MFLFKFKVCLFGYIILLVISTIAVMRPDATVVPPSRFYVGEVGVVLGDFLLNIHLVSDIFQILVISEQMPAVLKFLLSFLFIYILTIS